ncbi:hypothetical protein WDW89_06025 [Deltaproteobacteria bacterium TL4]
MSNFNPALVSIKTERYKMMAFIKEISIVAVFTMAIVVWGMIRYYREKMEIESSKPGEESECGGCQAKQKENCQDSGCPSKTSSV